MRILDQMFVVSAGWSSVRRTQLMSFTASISSRSLMLSKVSSLRNVFFKLQHSSSEV